MKTLTKKEIEDLMDKESPEVKEHTELSASWSKIWLHCTKATELSRLFPQIETTESFATEGTMAHYLGEQLLLGKLTMEQIPNEFKELQLYLDKATEIKGDGNLQVEIRVDMTPMLKSHTPIYGRSDFIVLQRDGSIDIGDLKWGQGVHVNAYKNDQLMLYAIGTLQFLQDVGLFDLDEEDPETPIRLHIIQPRVDLSYSYYNTTLKALIEFKDFVVKQLAKIKEHDLELCKGDHCQFCKGKTFCPTYTGSAEALAVATKEELPMLTNERLMYLYSIKKDVNAFYTALEKFIKAKIMESPNKQFMGYTISASKGQREVVDEEALYKQFEEAGCDRANLQISGAVGMSVIDKLAKKYNINKEDIKGIGYKGKETISRVPEEKAKEIFSKGDTNGSN